VLGTGSICARTDALQRRRESAPQHSADVLTTPHDAAAHASTDRLITAFLSANKFGELTQR
jgi:hypothetical protein